ncbi:beta-ketoacyl-ACP synthase II [Lentilactobacillus buchneri]|uniref:3-oxoacyl-[acyl-carrier-protein] synthase 2 n=2 Tax=Lentilactobacillus buchneri TaxID=1581 RepID=J9W9D4_LENBU|nr:beta-ketoacyl-ACP synthase II [Lentilactobacillus buchneri]MCC6101213.1 beta-ketoacyl-ACP synthase II [Lactobacillus sp.]AEB73915.1 3-oxoacyl-(acyl-carrier-protein) synthase 2 [Lentilactobacillus buchneri NRRL B-30929]AFS00741.1 3-oxoacyl-[acyl-carrier-protein] synthase II [Lentilactobacillus buchneri subsp. silagei CD034]MCT2882314.1 beta-ketoacyl-[acyl-carrier-protein] synthase II [Lentilactobacillus buchneri]MCT2898637.1 beta-ketoacyl-[acyl-carrier-protein] synthase II [Lentilactobacillu
MSRVVVTGLGAVTPIGNDVDSFLENLFASKVGIAPITKFDSEPTGITVAGEVKDFDPLKRVDKKFAKRNDLFCTYALYSATEAMENAGLIDGGVDPEELGVIYGSGIGGLTTIEQQVIKMHDKSPKRVSPLFVPDSIINMAAGNISIAFNAKNTSQAIVTACSSGTNAIGNAFEYIKQGKAQVMIAGGTEASVNEIGIAGFAALTALSKETDPKKASIPFDKDRNGFVMGEGSATLILEDYDHAKARGAKILAEVVGYGTTSDAYHMTAPDPEGKGAKRAMQQAVKEAGIDETQVDYINAHGTSTHANDSAEAKAINEVFANNDHVKVSSTKGMTGHALGAAGAIEAVATIGAILHNQMPVNVGVVNQDEECDVELVDDSNKNAEVNYAISNSFGFGGHNAVIAFKGCD